MTAITLPYRLTWDVPKSSAATGNEPVVWDRSVWWRSWVTLPRHTLGLAPAAQKQAKEILDWTGMSQRSLAEVLGTTHPTVGALLSGQATDFIRRPEIRRRLSDVHALSERLAALTHHDSGGLMALLASQVDDVRIIDLAAQGQPARAYLLALASISPANDQDFPASVFPAIPGTAIAALHD